MTRTEYNQQVRILLAAKAAHDRCLAQNRHAGIEKLSDDEAFRVARVLAAPKKTGRVSKTEQTDLRHAVSVFQDQQPIASHSSWFVMVSRDLDGIENRNRIYAASK